jgi:EAL domain-containing protein (putative c-di-GMP-specific phosphodiesterase class I)
MLLTRSLPPPAAHAFVPPGAAAIESDSMARLSAARLAALRASPPRPALLADEALILHCQEVMRLAAAAEAPMLLDVSVRLRGEEDGQTAPGAFLALIEDDRLMAALDRRVIERALDWCRSARPAREVILNVSVSEDVLLDLDFPGFVADAMSERDLDPRVLCLEVSQSVANRLPPSAHPGITDLADLGCRFAVGASTCGSDSLAAMKMLRAEFVRISGSLVRDLLQSAQISARVAAVHRVCRAAGVHTVAECVECPTALRHLEEMGVTYAQGLAFADLQPLTFRG